MKLGPDDVGMCPATLLADPLRCDAQQFEQITRASAAAGFGALSMWSFYPMDRGLDRARTLLDDLGLSTRAVEATTHWVDGPGQALVRDAAFNLDVAAAFGADTLAACTLEASIESMDRAVEGFAALCRLADERGVRVCIEFLPWSAIPDLATAWRIVSESGAPNGGILLDMLHWKRQPGGPNCALLETIPGERIHYVQLCDAPSGAPTLPDDLMVEALTTRLVPGEGTIDAAELFSALEKIGADPFFAFEVFSTHLAAKGPEAMARELHQATTSRFDRG